MHLLIRTKNQRYVETGALAHLVLLKAVTNLKKRNEVVFKKFMGKSEVDAVYLDW